MILNMTQDEIIKQIALHKETILAIEKLETDSPVTDPMFADIIKMRDKMKMQAHSKIGKLQRTLERMNQ